MTDEHVPSKAELLDALHTSRDAVLRIVRAQPPARLEEGRYENGWNGRQILAHIASIEWSYPRLIDIARAPAAPEADPPTRAMRGGNDSYNDRQVAKRAETSVADLLAEFETNRGATIRAVEAADEALFSRRIRSAGGIVGPLATVFLQVAVSTSWATRGTSLVDSEGGSPLSMTLRGCAAGLGSLPKFLTCRAGSKPTMLACEPSTRGSAATS